MENEESIETLAKLVRLMEEAWGRYEETREVVYYDEWLDLNFRIGQLSIEMDQDEE